MHVFITARSVRGTKKYANVNRNNYCNKKAIKSNFTYIDCGDVAPDEIVQNPKLRCLSNGIDFSYPVENWILSCHVRFINMTVKSPLDVTSRMVTAHVIFINSSIFPEALFNHNGILYEVLEVDDINLLVRCGPVQDLNALEVVLPADLVARQVESFGS